MNSRMLVVVAAVAALSAPGAHALPLLGPTGNYYELVATPADWPDVLAAAASRTYQGATGHLVTITSDAENDFVQSLNQGQYTWIAASDEETEGTWKWVAGPEAGEVFWQDGATLTYAAWAGGEPNDFDFGEDVAWMYPWGEWNDIHGPGYDTLAYVVEYEASEIPEPGTLALVGFGAVASSVACRRARSAHARS